jgi:hypothetical protein
MANTISHDEPDIPAPMAVWEGPGVPNSDSRPSQKPSTNITPAYWLENARASVPEAIVQSDFEATLPPGR